MTLNGPRDAAIQANPYSASADVADPASDAEAQHEPRRIAAGSAQDAESGAEAPGRGQLDHGSRAAGGNRPVAAAGGHAGGTAPSGMRPQAAPPQDQAPSREQTASASGASIPQAQRELVRRQGRDWALPESIAGARGNAVVRTIRVQCYRDRFVLLPASANAPAQVFGVADGRVKHATLQLATAVRDRIRGWGAAIPGGRWQPRLQVEVMPQGETRFHQLRTLMSGSGVDIEGRRAR